MNEYEKQIVSYLKEIKTEINIFQLSEKLEFSYPTILKYVATLESKKMIKIRDMGNVKLVSL